MTVPGGASTEGGVVLGRGGVFVLADAPAARHVLLAGDHEGRVAPVHSGFDEV